jgi:hypothetical protein
MAAALAVPLLMDKRTATTCRWSVAHSLTAWKASRVSWFPCVRHSAS